MQPVTCQCLCTNKGPTIGKWKRCNGEMITTVCCFTFVFSDMVAGGEENCRFYRTELQRNQVCSVCWSCVTLRTGMKEIHIFCQVKWHTGMYFIWVCCLPGVVL